MDWQRIKMGKSAVVIAAPHRGRNRPKDRGVCRIAIGSPLLCALVPGLVLTLCLTCCSNAKRTGSSSSEGPDPVETIDHLDDACYNPYYPISAETTLEYRSTFTGGMAPYEYTVSYSDLSPASFTRHQESSAGEKLDTTWKCQRDGLMAEQYGDLSIGQPRLQLVTIKGSGTMIPPAARWQKGLKWDYGYDVKGQMTFGNATRSVDVEGAVSVSCTIVADERVNVPAGSFDSVKVVSTFNQTLKMNGTLSMPMDISFKVTSWYAKDVGLIKTASVDMKQTTELVSY